MGLHGIDPDQPLVDYLEGLPGNTTKTGPSYSEIVYDRSYKVRSKE